MDQCDVVVVGAGAMGSAAAWHLARAGRDVVVLDAFEQGHTRGSSHGASRIFRLAYADPVYTALAVRARDAWSEAEAAYGGPLVEVTGGVDHGDPATLAEIEATLRAARLPVERLSARAAEQRWPGMRFAGDVVFQPDAGRAYADRAVAAFQSLAAREGADLRFRMPARALEPDPDGVTVATDAGSVRARVAVVTAGGWAAQLLAGLVELPPLAVTREQPAFFRPRDPAVAWPSFVHYDAAADAGHYGLDSPGEGVKVGGHRVGPETDPDDDPPPEPALLAEVSAYVERWLPGLDPEPVGTTTCLYTTTPSHDFVLDRVGPLVVGSPCSGHGFKFTPEVGRLLAALATGAGGVPDRFALRR